MSDDSQPDEAAVARCLRGLAAAYPAFTFSYAALGWKGRRWTAERAGRAAPGLVVVITGDLAELHAALRPYRDALATAGDAR